MKNMNKLPLLAAFVGLLSTVSAVTPIEVQGAQLVNSKTKDRFQIIGVDYQPGGSSGYKPQSGKDALSDADICLRDATLLQRLGVNTIRIYNVSPNINHDQCVSIFNAAGIYIILDVNTPDYGQHLNREDPKSTYHKGYLKHIFSMVEAFKDYPNLLGFFGANEIINEKSSKDVPAYIRAVQRDLKSYIDKHASRKIPVGYSAADVREILEDTWRYVSCDTGDLSRADFFGLNSYSWCGDSSYTTSGYDKLVAMFSKTSLPVLFSEYGCNEVKPRIFTEVQALYGKEMAQAMCGGLVYEYSMEENEYGLVSLKDDKSAKILIDYDNLMEQYHKIDIQSLQSLSPNSNQPEKCTSSLIKSDGFLNKFDIPKLPEGGKELIEKGVPGAKNGKLVNVKKTKVESKVYDKEGNVITGLELKILSDDQSNAPGENTSGQASRTSAASPKKTGAAAKSVMAGVAPVLAAVAAAFALLA
ncbi:Glycolipid anchored surface protein 4 precursor [Emydomyces testavorans]|uniref:1,3-beta-glucanosyltransferase n=1 Tax=Emydomyces testavorans TaxID=2070801 RepID=A0AAF0DE71_9EURO|nr:Glycolipid anchored surface protein 4 precursor [Emydomyces testavorans]